jgi:hypothetical protein
VTVWPVFVEGWQLECCGDVFAIGDDVAWTLVLLAGGDSELPDELLAPIDADSRGSESDDQGSPVGVVGVGTLNAAWPAGSLVVDRVTIRGVFREEHHGDVPADLPATRGTVRRIRLVEQFYRRVHGVTWVPEPGRARLADLAEAPKAFAQDLGRGGDEHWVATGLLVDLDVPDA